MTTRNYPVLTVRLDEAQILGILVGTDKRVIAESKEAVLYKLSRDLTKAYRKSGDYPNAYFDKARLRVVWVKLHPTYSLSNSKFPLSNELKVPIWAVYGSVNKNYMECVLPFLEVSFRYHKASGLGALISHYGTYYLNRLSPEQLFQMVLQPKPDLDFIQLKINENRTLGHRAAANSFEAYELLSKVATPYPSITKKNKRIVPDIAWNRTPVIEHLVREILVSQSSLIIVGKSGVGKSTVLRATMRKIVMESKKQGVSFSFWNLMPDSLLFSGKYLGDWQENSIQLIEDLQKANGILWVENLIELLTSGGESVSDSIAASFLPSLKNQSLQIIGEVSPQGLTFLRNNFPDFVQIFRVISLEEISQGTLQNLFQKYIQYVDQNHKVKIKLAALQVAYRLLEKYYPYEAFPGKMIFFLGDCVNRVISDKKAIVDRALVYQRFSEKSGLQRVFIEDEVKLDTQELNKYFEERIIGQAIAVEKCASLVKVFKTGLNNPYKPIHVMLFAGPTGVGKTETTKVLAKYFFGRKKGEIPLIQFDMSEFQYPEQISSLIGTKTTPGKLVKKIKEMPFAVILFDEIEKASSSIYNTLLTIFDEGKMMDARGGVVNFKNTIIIMTSNIGVKVRGRISINEDADSGQQFSSAIHKHFSPEFINRIDDIIIFNKLSPDDLAKIALLELKKLNQREGLTSKRITVCFDELLVQKIVELGYDPDLGARPIKRTIEQLVVVPLSKWILSHPKSEDLWLHLSYTNNALVITPSKKLTYG